MIETLLAVALVPACATILLTSLAVVATHVAVQEVMGW